MNSEDSYSNGPYVGLLPKEGFDVCWVDPPNRQLADSQVAGEYVANAIINLAPKSKTKKVKVIGHSQGGGLSIPWATIFFPSARKLVSGFVGLAADFHGTILLPYPACAAEKVLSFGAGCAPAILQQERGSMFLNAQLHFLTQEIVPTTSIFTRTDEIVIPQFGPNVSRIGSEAREQLSTDGSSFRVFQPSSALKNSVQFPLQDYCTALELTDHLEIIFNPAAYAITLLALNSPTGKADLSKFNFLRDCFNISNSDINLNTAATQARYLASTVVAVLDSGGAYVQSEPGLKQCEWRYEDSSIFQDFILTHCSPPRFSDVCDAGAATKCGVPGPIPPVLDVPQAASAFFVP